MFRLTVWGFLLVFRLLDPRFNYCNLILNNYLSSVSAEMSANVSVLRDFLLFRDNPDVCSYLLIRMTFRVLLGVLGLIF